MLIRESRSVARAVLAAAALTLTACGGARPQVQTYHPGLAASAATDDSVLTASSEGGGDAARGGETAAQSTGGDDAPRAEAAAKPAADPRQSTATPRRRQVKRMVIQTADLEIITSNPADGFDKAVRMAKQMGGYTLDSSRSDKRLRVTLRIPGARFEEALRRLSKLGKVDKRAIGGRDVTTEFVDLTMRLKNAERVRERYIELLKRAQNVSEALQVQKELERITAQIESFKGRISVIDNQVSLATISLTLETPTRPGPVGWVFYGLYKGLVWLFVWD